MSNINFLVGKYLIHSYLYYCLARPIISDSEYDLLCGKLATDYDSITHPHKHLLSLEVLRCGSAYHLKLSDYPSIVKDAANALSSGFFT